MTVDPNTPHDTLLKELLGSPGDAAVVLQTRRCRCKQARSIPLETCVYTVPGHRTVAPAMSFVWT